MSVRKFCCFIVLLINLSCTVYMRTTPNFVCADDTDNAAVTRHGKTFAKATKVYRTLGSLRELAKTKGHQRIAATTEPPATTKDAATTNQTTTAATPELATTKNLPTIPPSTVVPSTNPASTTVLSSTTKSTTTAALKELVTDTTLPLTPPSTVAPSTNPPSTTTTSTHTTTTTETAPAITKTPISDSVTSIKDNKKKLGIYSTTKASNSFPSISKSLFSNGKWKLPETAPPGTWIF